MQAAQDQYFASCKEPYRSLQQQGTKVHAHQSDNELVLDVFTNNWTTSILHYGATGLAWTTFLITALASMSLGSAESALLASVVALMIAMAVDMFFMLGIVNRSLDTLVLTSRRILWLRHRGFVSHSSDHMSFDNVNDCIHSVGGVFASKIAKEGTLVLKLSSGEERVFKHIPRVWDVANSISRVREMYVSFGQSTDFQYLFAAQSAAPAATADFKSAITSLQDRYNKTTLSSVPPTPS